MARRRGGALALVAALALGAGCSEDAAPVDPGEDVDRTSRVPADRALREGLADLYAGSGPTKAAAATAACFADALLERLDPVELADAGLVVDGTVVEQAPALPETTARAWYDAQEACTDFITVSARAQRAATRGEIDEPAYEECLRRVLSDAQIEDAVVASLMGEWEEPALAELSTAQSDCAAEALPRG